MEDLKQYCRENKLATIGSLWAAGIGASMLMQSRGASSTSVKVIHSRLYAQALTLSALVGAAGVEYYDRTYNPKPAVEEDPFTYEHTHKAQLARQ